MKLSLFLAVYCTAKANNHNRGLVRLTTKKRFFLEFIFGEYKVLISMKNLLQN